MCMVSKASYFVVLFYDFISSTKPLHPYPDEAFSNQFVLFVQVKILKNGVLFCFFLSRELLVHFLQSEDNLFYYIHEPPSTEKETAFCATKPIICLAAFAASEQQPQED